ncbi:MAG: phosphatase PAP2 family protein [Crocinitomicaceae bacterium]|nr:phosphatase PAP2 family protein [Crocinitomicaceae bacterium]MBK8924421.1 phosphatase PAP2 family protein [Crocinitomicaceae bacterium]
MQKRVVVVIGLASLLFLNCNTYAGSDSLLSTKESGDQRGHYFDVSWAPVGLSLLSVSLMLDSSKYGLQKLIRDPFNGFHTELEDYTQYAPIVMMYTADLFKVPAKNSVWNQTKYLVFSEIGTSAIVHLLKNTLKVQRPNSWSLNSYPSGHTSQAFVASQVLFNEYRETAPVLAYSGFAFSISTGMLRIVNNRHWLPDVLLGAGIAMLVTNTIYYFEPLKKWNPFKNKKRKTELGFIPSLRDDYIGAYLSIKF